MFYQCPKCKKVWQYPIKKCSDCFSDLKKIESKKIKVIGVSKATISSITHPKTPYFALVLEDENKNRWVYKSKKEYKIGDEFKIEKTKNKNAVSIWRIKYDDFSAIRKAIELINNLNINENSKILILPTLIKPKHSYFSENTRPEFLEALLLYLFEKEVKPENIKVVSQSFDETPIEVSALKSGLLGICQKYKVLALDFSKTNFKRKEYNNFSFEISEEIFNADLIINLPILKIGQTSSFKNILKILKKENYLGLKYLYSENDMIKNLFKTIPSYLTIADGWQIQKPDKFTTFFGIILASFNSLNLERVFYEIVMAKDLPEILKEIKIENIEIAGRDILEVQHTYEQ